MTKGTPGNSWGCPCLTSDCYNGEQQGGVKMECEYKNCVSHADWYMVAGTTKCGDILVYHFCEAHKTVATMMTNLPYYLTDTHGHHMEEVMITSLRSDAAPLVFTNDTLYPCITCGAGHLTLLEIQECKLDHEKRFDTTPQTPRKCGLCGTRHPSLRGSP